MASITHGTTARTHNSQFSPTESRNSRVSKPEQESKREIDDVIASLATMPENRRARQVGEWERISRQVLWSWL